MAGAEVIAAGGGGLQRVSGERFHSSSRRWRECRRCARDEGIVTHGACRDRGVGARRAGSHVRAALVPVAAPRAKGLDVSVTLSRRRRTFLRHVTGGGLAFAERAMKAGQLFGGASATRDGPDLSGCRAVERHSAARGVMLRSRRAGHHGDPAFRTLVETLLTPKRNQRRCGAPGARWGSRRRLAPAGGSSKRGRRAVGGEGLPMARLRGMAATFVSYIVMRLGSTRTLRPGRLPARGRRESDFRKYDDSLAHDAGLHVGALRPDRAATRAGQARRHRRFGLPASRRRS